MATPEEREKLLISFVEQLYGNAGTRAHVCPACESNQRMAGVILRTIRKTGGDVRPGAWDEEEGG